MPTLVKPFGAGDRVGPVETKVTTGLFTGGVGTVAGSDLTTASLSATQKNYYYNFQKSSIDQFSVAYGHIGGSGSTSVTNVIGETEAIYKQISNLILSPTNEGAADSIDEGIQFVSGTLENDVYIISFERSLMKDRINRKNWTLTLSGSAMTGSTEVVERGASLSLTDDSETTKAVTHPLYGSRYNVRAGALGVVSDASTAFGHFFPDLGLIVLSANQLSASIPGIPDFTASVAPILNANVALGFVSGSGFTPDLRNDGNADNASKIAHAIKLGSLTYRSEEDQLTESYFCRATAPDFNFSNNPTYTSGSLGEYRNKTYYGNPQTFITTVGLYDGASKLVAVGRLSAPVLKNFQTEAVIKVNLTY